MESLTIACCQFHPSPGDKQANVRRMAEWVDRAAEGGAELVVFPELVVTGYLRAALLPSLAEPVSGPAVESLRSTAREHGVSLVFGFPETDAHGTLHNSCAAIDSAGVLLGVYRKMHLWDTEHGWATAGEGIEVWKIGRTRLSAWICYDTRFPEVGRLAALSGAELAAVPTAWLGPPDEWETALRGRALDNALFVAGADLVDPSLGCHGRSIIVDPHGRVLARAVPEQEGMIFAHLESGIRDEQLARVPLLRHRRPRLYGSLAEEQAYRDGDS